MRHILFYLVMLFASVAACQQSRTADELQLTLPPGVYAVPGVATNIFFDNVVLTESPNAFQFDVTCKIGQSDARRWSLIPTAADVGEHALSIIVRDADGNSAGEKSTVLHVIPAAAGAKQNGNLNLLIIGDSLTHASAYPNEIAALLSKDGNPKWSMLGTHKPAGVAEGVAHEGYGGWTWGRFVSMYEPNPDGTHRKRSSPFVFLNEDEKPELDVSRFFEESCRGQYPDYVVVMLGINDCFGAPPDDAAGIDAVIDRVFANADQLLSAIRKAAPKAEIGLCLTTPPNSRQEAFQANYKDRYTRWGWKRIQHRLVQRQMQYVAQNGDPQITIVPTQLDLDPVDGYPANNGVHPNASGYKQIGATVYAWLKWRMATAASFAATNPTDTRDVHSVSQ